MAIMQYRQYILPLIPGKEGNFQIRLNPLEAYSAYKQIDSQTLYLDKFSGAITPKLNRRMARTDYTGTPKYDSLSFNVYDPPSYTGREGDPTSGTIFSEDLTDSNGSLFDRILSDDNQQCRVYATYIPYDTGIPEPFFCGEFDPKNLPRNHSSVRFADDEDKESQLRTLEINCIDVLSRLSKVTIQDIFDAFPGSSPTIKKVSKWYAGTAVDPLDTDYPTTPVLIPARYDDASLDTTGTGAYRGLTGITIGNLMSVFCTLADFVTLSGDIDSAFDFYGSTYNATTNYTPYKFTSLTNLYILLNYWMGKGILSEDPEDFQYGNSWGRDKTGSDFFLQLMNQFGTTFFGQLEDIGSGNFVTTLQSLARNKSFGDIPTNWVTTKSSEKPRLIGKTSVAIQNSNDAVKLLAGSNESNSLSIEVPFRAHPFGAQSSDATFLDSLIPENFLFFDKKFGDGQPKNQSLCFKITNGNSVSKSSQDGWRGSTFLFAYASDVSGHLLHHFSYTQSTPEEAMIACCGCVPTGVSFPTDNDGGGYFNTLKAPAELYYKENIGNRIVLEREYHGITDDDGKLQTVRPGLEKYFPIRTISNSGDNRLFRADEIDQDLIAHSSKVTYKEVFTTFAPFTLRYIGDEGGTSNSGGNSVSSPNNSTASIDTSLFVVKKSLSNTQNKRTTANDTQIAENILEGSVAEGEIELEISNTSNDNVNILDADNKAYIWIRCITDGSLSATTHLTGINASLSTTLASIDGNIHKLLNQSGYDIVIKHNDSNSDTWKRFRTPDAGDFTLQNGYYVEIRYKVETTEADSRWEVISEPIPSVTITGDAHTVEANLTGSAGALTPVDNNDFINDALDITISGTGATVSPSIDVNKKTTFDIDLDGYIPDTAVILNPQADARNVIESDQANKIGLTIKAKSGDTLTNTAFQNKDDSGNVNFKIIKNGKTSIITDAGIPFFIEQTSSGGFIERFTTVYTNDDVVSDRLHGKLVITGNVSTAYATIDCSNTGGYFIRVYLQAEITGGTGTAGNMNTHVVWYQVTNVGGTLRLVNKLQQVMLVDINGVPVASQINESISGTNFNLEFQGGVGTTFAVDADIYILNPVES